MRMDRRDFVTLTAGMLAAVAIPGCASVAMTRVSAVDGRVRLPLRDHPGLAAPGGYLKILPAGSQTPIYVLVLEDEFVAVSPICTHLGCTVDVAGAQLICPCHGSTYDRSGKVLRGPAEEALRQFPSSVTADGELIIELEVGR